MARLFHAEKQRPAGQTLWLLSYTRVASRTDCGPSIFFNANVLSPSFDPYHTGHHLMAPTTRLTFHGLPMMTHVVEHLEKTWEVRVSPCSKKAVVLVGMPL